MQVRTQKFGNLERKTFSKTKNVINLPNLIEVQKTSYDAFIKRGIREVFDDFSPIVDYSGRFELQFLDYTIDSKSTFQTDVDNTGTLREAAAQGHQKKHGSENQSILQQQSH